MDISLYKDKKILETGTSNLLFVKNNQIYSPKSNFYKGTTFKFFHKKYVLPFYIKSKVKHTKKINY